MPVINTLHFNKNSFQCPPFACALFSPEGIQTAVREWMPRDEEAKNRTLSLRT
jgi:hypothetical protein